MGLPVVGSQGTGAAAADISPVIIAGVDGSGNVRPLKVTTGGAVVLDNSAVVFVTVQTGAPASTYITPLVYDNTAVTGGLYGWTGTTYTKIGGLAS